MAGSQQKGDLQVDTPLLHLRPLYKGIILGALVGMVYCISLLDVASLNVFSYSGLAKGNPSVETTTPYWLSFDGPPLPSEEERVKWILARWEASPLLNFSRGGRDPLVRKGRKKLGRLRLRPPHLEDCAARAAEYSRLDSRNANGTRPLWSLWKGQTATIQPEQNVTVEETEEFVGDQKLKLGPFPPWIEGADEDNLPMTRRVQRDLWLLQHPPDCTHKSVRFLVADWPESKRLGLGAQLVYVGGLLGIAMKEKRVLVLGYLDRAGHQGCQGSDHAMWSCYFVPETTEECRSQARALGGDRRALRAGTVITGRSVGKRQDPWSVYPPELWGGPWEDMQPTTEIEGHLLIDYQKKYVRWWRSQAVRYLMRFPSEYTCMLMNQARHDAFGMRAATQVLRASQLQQRGLTKEADMEKWIWTSQKPWIPRPMLSVHIRIGDKGKEMKLADFDAYMALANRLRMRFPHVGDIWLSSEMQNVIDSSKTYPGWNFHYTQVPRQVGNTSMHDYELAMGAERSLRNSIVNFLMASDSDFFIGALGSTWCFLVDGMRSTAGKQMAGYLSVNRDRYWR